MESRDMTTAMRGIMLSIAATLAGLALAAPTHAQAPAPTAQPLRVDPRIRTITYDPGQVVSLRGFIGNLMLITWDPD
jgi:hypothetical protein